MSERQKKRKLDQMKEPRRKERTNKGISKKKRKEGRKNTSRIEEGK